MATAMPDVPFFDTGEKLKGHGRTLGVVGLLVVAQLFVILDLVDGSTLLGNLTPFTYDIALYIGLFAVCVGMLAASGTIKPLLAQPATAFALKAAAWAGLTWVVMTLLFSFGSSSSSLLGSQRIQYFVFDAVFVASVEELAFRVVFPAVLPGGWFIWSSLGFAGFHALAYSVEFGASLSQFGPELVIPGFMGVVLWFIYRLGPKGQPGKWGGYAACYAVHLTYDLFVLGVISGLPIALVHLGIVPI